MRAKAWCCAAAAAMLVLLAAPVGAQTIYKSVQHDGSVLYSDKPLPGAAKVERINPSEGTLSVIPNPDVRTQGTGRAAVDQRIAERQAALDRADAEIKAATTAIERAEQRLAEGEEPLPGERTGNATGGTRLNDLYVGRVAAIQQQLEAARARLDAAYAARNSLRD